MLPGRGARGEGGRHKLTWAHAMVGPDLNQDTVGNGREAGFRLHREQNVYVDIVQMMEAVKEQRGARLAG